MLYECGPLVSLAIGGFSTINALLQLWTCQVYSKLPVTVPSLVYGWFL